MREVAAPLRQSACACGVHPACGGGTSPSSRRRASSDAASLQGRMRESRRSSGGSPGSASDQPPHPTSGRSGRRCSHARWTSDFVPARPPITMQASPASAMSRLRASPMPHGTTTVAGQLPSGITSGGMMLRTSPPAAIARSAATRVAGLPHPLTTVSPSAASNAPASAALSKAELPGSALPRTATCGRRMRAIMEKGVQATFGFTGRCARRRQRPVARRKLERKTSGSATLSSTL